MLVRNIKRLGLYFIVAVVIVAFLVRACMRWWGSCTNYDQDFARQRNYWSISGSNHMDMSK